MKIIHHPESSCSPFGRPIRMQGFTLLELLISLSIMAVIITIIFGGLRVGIRAWEKGEKYITSQQHLRIVPELVKRQIASLSMAKVFKRNNSWFFLQGDSKSLEFFSSISLYPESEAGIVYVRYMVTGDEQNTEKMAFYEKDINFLDPAELTDIDDTSHIDLLTGYTSISFAFLADQKNNDGEKEWLPAWSPEEKDGLLRAVRVMFQNDEKEQPVTVVIPIIIAHDEG